MSADRDLTDPMGQALRWLAASPDERVLRTIRGGVPRRATFEALRRRGLVTAEPGRFAQTRYVLTPDGRAALAERIRSFYDRGPAPGQAR